MSRNAQSQVRIHTNRKIVYLLYALISWRINPISLGQLRHHRPRNRVHMVFTIRSYASRFPTYALRKYGNVVIR